MRGPRRPGFSLVEVLSVLLLLSVILVVAFGVLQSGDRERKLVTDYADIAHDVRRAVKRLERDVRATARFQELTRDSTTFRRMTLEIPRSTDPLDGFEPVTYEFDPTHHTLRRGDRVLLDAGVHSMELFAFDDLGRQLRDEGAPWIAFVRLRFDLGDPEDPPNRRRLLDLTLSPRILSSRAKAERVLLERAFERFDEVPEDLDEPGRRF